MIASLTWPKNRTITSKKYSFKTDKGNKKATREGNTTYMKPVVDSLLQLDLLLDEGISLFQPDMLFRPSFGFCVPQCLLMGQLNSLG